MLIKVYEKYTDHLHIIENVTDVTVKNGTYSHNQHLDHCTRTVDPYQYLSFDGPDPLIQQKAVGRSVGDNRADDDYECRIIEFAKNGPMRLYVGNLAYVCNDAGKTIETVQVRPLIVPA